MRTIKPYWKKSHGAWYVNLNKRPVRLAEDEEGAWKKYHGLMAERQEVTPDSTVQALIGRFLEWTKAKVAEGSRKPDTYEFYAIPLTSFGDHIGTKLKVSRLKWHHVEGWVTKRYAKTGDNTRHNAVRSIKRVFNWACEQGHLDVSPLAHTKNPYQATPRDTYIDPPQFEQVYEAIRNEEFRDFVAVMRGTGCRPKEVASAEARHFNRRDKALVFEIEESKAGKKTRQKRVILLDGEALAIVERLALKYPEGRLFRNTRGGDWTKDSVVQQFEDIRKRVGFQVTAYTIRHAWATDAAARNVPIHHVAQLMGHKDLKMLLGVYSHLEKKGDTLRESLRIANGETTPPPVSDAGRHA